MTKTATPVAAQERKEANVLVIELVKQNQSNYFLDNGKDGEMGGAMPQALSVPSAQKIKARSVVKQWNEAEQVWKHVPIRYIKGCDEILVSKQDAALIKPVPQEDVIWIINGKLTVVESGGDIGKYRYLKAYEGNVDNPNRPDGAPDVFREIHTDVTAEATVIDFDAEYEVLSYLKKLKVNSTGTETVYNEDVLEFLCKLFKLGSFDNGFKSEAWVALATHAKADPAKFLTRINAERSVIEQEVFHAIELGAIEQDQVKAVIGGSNMLLMEFKSTDTVGERSEKLIDFLANPKNLQLRQEVALQLQAKRKAKLENVR